MKLNIIILGLCGAGIIALAILMSGNFKGAGIACTLEAKQCPDGSYVGRVGPSCEFKECPLNTKTYVSTRYGFSITYPSDFTIDEHYSYTELGPGKEIPGVSFTVPMNIATGTNLSSDTRLSVEEFSNTTFCTASLFLYDTVVPKTMTENGVTYSVASTNSAGAGNFYEETVYAIFGSKPCVAVRYFIHSSNIGNYPPGVVKEFDRNALLSAFDAMRRSLAPTTTASNSKSSGTLQGTMTIGPICPVEQIGHPCLPTPEMFAAHKVYVYVSNKTTLISTLTPDVQGKFSAVLGVGDYYVDVTHQSVGAIRGVPVTTHINANQTTTLSIDIDTGIR